MATEEQKKQTESAKLKMRIDYFAVPFAQVQAFWAAQPDSEDKQDAIRSINTMHNHYAAGALVHNFNAMQVTWQSLLAKTNYEIAWQNHQNDPDKKRGQKVIRGAKNGGKEANIWKKRAVELQQIAEKIAVESPNLSFEDIKRIMVKRYQDEGENISTATLKRYVVNPLKR